MSTVIPKDRKWLKTNSSDVFGNLFSCYNVNFDEMGYIGLSPKSVSIASSATSNFKMPGAIYYFSTTGSYFIMTQAGSCFTLGSSLALAEISSSPTTTSNSDSVSWQGRAYVTTTNNLSYYDGSWTNNVKSLTAGKPHPLEVFANKNSLAIGNGNTVLLLDTSHTTTVTLTIPADYQVECLKYFQNNLYIGTSTVSGREGKIFVWNGVDTSAQAAYNVGAHWVFAMEEYQSSIACVTSQGQLLKFSGSGFTPLDDFPVYYSRYRWTSSAVRVHRRGMKVEGTLIYINVQGAVSGVDDYQYIPNQPSGIWCYDPDVGLYPRHLSTSDLLLSKTVSSLSANVLTLSSSTLATTGEPVFITSVGSITGISANTTYYVIRVSSTTISLALTPYNAFAGTAITLGGSAGGATVKLIGYVQYGEKYSRGDVGALGLISTDPTSPLMFPEIVRTNLVWGYSNDTPTYYLNSLSAGKNVGGFITTKMWSSEVQDSFNKVYLKYSGLYLDSDSILVKTRNKEIFGLPPTPVSGTFSTQSMIGTASTILGAVAANYNINLLNGNGAGQSVGISSIGGATEYTLDETLTNVSAADATTFEIDNFVTRGTIDSDDTFGEVPFSGPSSWNQIMVELRGQRVLIEELQVVNEVNQPTE